MLKIKYRVKNRAAPPKLLFDVDTWVEKDKYTLIEQSELVLLTVEIYYQSSYSCQCYFCVQFRYI